MRLLARPQLYADNEGRPVLLATKCRRCSRVAFPALEIGCDNCGAVEDDLECVQLSATGITHATVVVPATSSKAQSFAVAEVQLDGGPLIRAMISPDEPIQIGDRLVAVWTASRVDGDGNELFEPLFGSAAKAGETA